MNLVKQIDRYDDNNVFFCEPIKNNIMTEAKEMFYDESFLLKSTKNFLIEDIKKELIRLRNVTKTVMYKLSLFCIYDTLITYIS